MEEVWAVDRMTLADVVTATIGAPGSEVSLMRVEFDSASIGRGVLENVTGRTLDATTAGGSDWDLVSATVGLLEDLDRIAIESRLQVRFTPGARTVFDGPLTLERFDRSSKALSGLHGYRLTLTDETARVAISDFRVLCAGGVGVTVVNSAMALAKGTLVGCAVGVDASQSERTLEITDVRFEEVGVVLVD